MFEQTFVAPAAKTRRAWTVVISFTLQVLTMGVVVLIPLVWSEKLPMALLRAPLVQPPPPPGPPKPPAVPEHVRIVHTSINRTPTRGLTVPTRIPPKPAMIVDEAPTLQPREQGFYVPGSTGSPDGVPHSIFSELAATMTRGVAPPPEPVKPPPAAQPTARPAAPVRVGGDVQAAKLAHKVMPAYPPLARQARVAGTVRLEAVIGADGRIRQLRLVSGHPLLAPAALDAVRQWVSQSGPEAAKAIAGYLAGPMPKQDDPLYVPPVTAWLLSEFEDDDQVFEQFRTGRNAREILRGAFSGHFESPEDRIAPYLDHPLRRVREWAQGEIDYIRELNC